VENHHTPPHQRNALAPRPRLARDYFDRYIRNDAHYEANKRYIEMNPVAAGLCETPEAWPFSSAGWKAR
jgi:hypothetical protein